MQRLPIKSERDSIERGSITAELAMALPAVALVIAITLGAFSLQIERMKLVEVSASAARAVARGESEENARALIYELLFPIAEDAILIESMSIAKTWCVPNYLVSLQYPDLARRYLTWPRFNVPESLGCDQGAAAGPALRRARFGHRAGLGGGNAGYRCV